jgi:hypothetical protein
MLIALVSRVQCWNEFVPPLIENPLANDDRVIVEPPPAKADTRVDPIELVMIVSSMNTWPAEVLVMKVFARVVMSPRQFRTYTLELALEEL